MKLPFIQQRGIGLHFSEGVIRWVDLSRFGNSIKILAVDEEHIEDNDVREALTRLVTRIRPDYPFVTTNLNPPQVKEFVVPFPGFDEEEYLENWLQEQKNAILTPELDPEEFQMRYHLFGGEDEQQCLFAVAPNQAVQQHTELLASAGLTPVSITSGTIEMTWSCLFDEEWVQGDRYLVKAADTGATIYTLHHGSIMELKGLDYSGASVNEVLEEITTLLISKDSFSKTDSLHHNLFLCTDVSGWDTVPSIRVGQREFHFVPLRPLHSIRNKSLRKKTGVASPEMQFATGIGMAIGQLYPALGSVNLLGEETQTALTNQIPKKDALNTGILLGGLVVLVWLLIFVVQCYYQSKLTAASEQVNLLNDKITAVANADSELTRWTHKVKQAEQLISQRTRFATLMEEIGKSVPTDTWLTKMDIKNSGARSEVILQGVAQSEARVSSLMKKLEHIQKLSEVRLAISEQVREKDIYKNAPYGNVSLIRFEILCTANE